MNAKQSRAGYIAFFLSGLCSISSSIIVAMLQEEYGFDYSMTGTLLALMNIGNLAAGFLSGLLPGKIGIRPSILIMTIGYFLGYLIMGLTGVLVLLIVSFIFLGIAKGNAINTCTILVSNHVSDRSRGMNLMHGCYACGALLCPFVIAAGSRIHTKAPLFLLGILGLLLWGIFAATPLDETGTANQKEKTDWSFLKNSRFWLLTGILFCQNAAEVSVTGWLVTYFNGTGIIDASLSHYMVTVMWGATLIARMLIAFVFPIRNVGKAMTLMSVGVIIFFIPMVMTTGQIPAILLLFAFSFAMAGMNPTATACAGKMTTVTSMGVMIPTASLGAILMPWIIGLAADKMGLVGGMAINIIPCIGLLVLSMLISKMKIEA